MKTLKVGIASYADMKVRTMAIARGEYQPKRGEPRVWFTSMESFSRVLSDRNRKLLDLIAAAQPNSIAELAELSGRAKSNLSRTLKTLEGYGLVRLQEGAGGKVAPRIPYSDIVLDMPIGAARTVP
jgi:predicted transcriptional regulator